MSPQFEFRLKIKSGEDSWIFTVPKGVTNVGSGAGNELVLAHDLVSPRHARIHCTSTNCQIADLESAGGTFLNGRRLISFKPAALSAQDRLKIGDFEIVVEQAIFQHDSPIESLPAVEDTKASLPKRAEIKSGVPAAVHPPRQPPPHSSDSPPTTDGRDPGRPPPGLSFCSHRLLSYLPDIYQEPDAEKSFLSHYLAIFEAILFPVEWQIDNFDLFLDPKTSPIGFLPWLANWFDVVFDAAWEETQRRIFLSEASQIFARRGTPWALSRSLEIFTGQRPAIFDTGDSLAAFTFRIELPFEQTKYPKGLLEKLIDQTKPVYTRYTLVFKE